MKIASWLALAALLAQGLGASAQEPTVEQGPGARIWLDRGDEPLLQRGDRVRVYYRTEEDAFVAVFHVDSDGLVTLLHPRAPEEESFTRGGRDYRLLFPQSSYWYVDEYPGKGYFFLVAAPEPLALEGLDFSYQERRWDLSRVGQTVYRDPYLAMDDYVALLIPDWQSSPYALDFLSYDVGEAHEYPRFLCYDCHGYRSYSTWNPYTYACASFRVVVWDDPWFYPSLRYQGVRVVYAPPRRGVARFEFKERAPGEAWTPLIRSREATPRRSVGYAEPGVARGVAPSAVTPPARSAPSRDAPSRQATPSPAPAPSRQASPSPAPTPSRQVAPPAAAPRRSEPSGAVAPPASGERPVLQRRPSSPAPSSPSRPSGGTATPRPPSADPGAAVTRPSSGGTRTVTPPRSGTPSARPSEGARPPSASRPAPSARPPSSGSRAPSSARPSSGGRASSGSGSKAAPPPSRRKPGGEAA